MSKHPYPDEMIPAEDYAAARSRARMLGGVLLAWLIAGAFVAFCLVARAAMADAPTLPQTCACEGGSLSPDCCDDWCATRDNIDVPEKFCEVRCVKWTPDCNTCNALSCTARACPPSVCLKKARFCGEVVK